MMNAERAGAKFSGSLMTSSSKQIGWPRISGQFSSW